MIQNTKGEMIFGEDDLCNFVMQGRSPAEFKNALVDETVNLESAISMLEDVPTFIRYNDISNESMEDFDHRCQSNWKMPQEYKDLDIAEYLLGLCNTDVELQRVGHELLLFQERDLFDLLKYLKYLVDVMNTNNVIWGVGRGSSVASYILYLLGVHRINSMFYELDPEEFLR
jgi:DNA polymerase III alpha subunit